MHHKGKVVDPVEAKRVLASPEGVRLPLFDRYMLTEAVAQAADGYNYYDKQAVRLKLAIAELTANFLSILPPVPRGYYISPCFDPEGPCIGWHCDRHHNGRLQDGGTQPTSELYCDGGCPTTLSWLAGTLQPIIETFD